MMNVFSNVPLAIAINYDKWKFLVDLYKYMLYNISINN